MNDPYFVRFQKIQKMWFQISEIYEQNCEKFPETNFSLKYSFCGFMN